MPLTRYQIRRAYSLADPELYVAADKDDPEALLEGVAMAGLVGVLRQLGDLSEFAAEIFHNLHEEVMTTAARGHGLMTRVQQVEAEFPTIEKALLSQTSHSSLFYNTGVDWHPNLHMDQNLITQGDLPRFVMDSYEECQGPPRLFLLDKFDVAGAGACLKRYTDPSFFKVDSPSSGITNADVQRDKKTRKAKKKGSRWRNGETPEVLPKSHAKLHQLFLVESVENHINDPARRVKLKRRPNGFPFDSKNGKSYMEKFLKAPKPDHNVVLSPEKELSLRKRSPCSSPDVMETGEKPSIYQLNEQVDHGISEVSGRNPVCEIDNVLSTLHEDFHEREMADDGERKIESVDGYRSDDVASEVDNYMDALTTMDSEIETDTERRAKNYLHSLNIENQGMESDANEEQHDLQARFSDSQSTGSSTATDEGNSSSRKEISSLSYSDSISDLAENTLSDDDIPKNLQMKVHQWDLELDEISSDRKELQPADCNPGENTTCLGDILRSTSNRSDDPSQERDDFLPEMYSESHSLDELNDEGTHILSPASLHHSCVLELAHGKNSSENSPDDMLQAEYAEDESLPELETYEPDKKPEGVVSEASDALYGEIAISSLPTQKRVLHILGKKILMGLPMQQSVKNWVYSPPEMDMFGEFADDLKFPSEFQKSADPSIVPEGHLNLLTGTVHSEVVTVASGGAGTHCDDNGDDGKSLSSIFKNLPQKRRWIIRQLLHQICTPFAQRCKKNLFPFFRVHVQNVMEANGVCSPDHLQESATEKENCSMMFLTLLWLPYPGNGLQIANATTVPLSADQNDQYSESKSSRPIDVIETANDAIACNTVSCDASCSELLNDVPDSVMAPIYRETIDVIETANDAISSNTHHTAELRPPVEQNVDLQDDQFDAESQHDQNSEPKSSQQINVVENVEDTVPLPILHIAELGTHLEQNLELQNDQFDVVSHHADKASSEPFSMVKRMQSPDHLDQERHNDSSSKFYDARSPSQFPVSNFFPPLAVSEQANNPSSSVLPPFSLLPKVSQLNLGDTPPLPPLPPMQWRIGKVQHVSLASERDLVRNNLDFFPQISPSRVNENAQLGHPSIEGEITQPPNPFLPLSTLKDENSLHGYENLASCMVHPDPSSLQMPATETSSEDVKLQGCSVISKGKVVNPPENTHPPPIRQDDHPQLVFSTSEGQTAWSSSTSILHPPVEEKGKPNGILQTKLPWPRNPLIDAVVAHDKSKLRKVTERIRPHVGQKIEERDSLLEQIRTKSFNLKPAVLTRPSIQGGPKTNLNVSAILEKANAIRQAFAGSDEDEDDEDSWSDS
ncbi:SCAR homolog 2 [Actinidia rufa]|uniref:Protein SCAR n=1 Tax=Actinidia rufa TaxID=165716 RepID=A0A7J0E7X3_9ERIC|nr:SCAR homolog 2 [Actinidia rufa]